MHIFDTIKTSILVPVHPAGASLYRYFWFDLAPAHDDF